jgi:hypothetical protein
VFDERSDDETDDFVIVRDEDALGDDSRFEFRRNQRFTHAKYPYIGILLPLSIQNNTGMSVALLAWFISPGFNVKGKVEPPSGEGSTEMRPP